MEYSAIILCGGKSKRMGTKKGNLILGGKTFIEILRDKFLSLGIEDIILAGSEISLPNTRIVHDIFSGMGPLAGIHAGLKNSYKQYSIIIGEDSPLIPKSFIQKLQTSHETNQAKITLAICKDRLQPLAGIYKKELFKECETLLNFQEKRVMPLIKKIGFNQVPYNDNELFIRGCNTPEEFLQLKELSNNLSLYD